VYAKLNVLHWHIVDYQSWPIQSLAYPLLWSAAWSPGERYTLADAAAVVEYARQRGVLVVPEFDSPGHADSVCTGYPQACPAPQCTTPLNPATNFTFDLITAVFTEWTSVFPSQYLHAGERSSRPVGNGGLCRASAPLTALRRRRRGQHQLLDQHALHPGVADVQQLHRGPGAPTALG
jgi:hypothetical protein